MCQSKNIKATIFALETICHLQPKVIGPPLSAGQIIRMCDVAREELEALEGRQLSSLEPLITDHEGDSDGPAESSD